jgi:CheY-like chemotaxis protein
MLPDQWYRRDRRAIVNGAARRRAVQQLAARHGHVQERRVARPSTPSPHPAILVLDDEPEIRMLVAELLRDAGYRPAEAATYDQALALLAAFRFDLVLADPPDAPDLRRAAPAQLLEAAGGTPVVLCSARDPSELADWAARGFAGLLAKPFDADELTAIVRLALGDAR